MPGTPTVRRNPCDSTLAMRALRASVRRRQENVKIGCGSVKMASRPRSRMREQSTARSRTRGPEAYEAALKKYMRTYGEGCHGFQMSSDTWKVVVSRSENERSGVEPRIAMRNRTAAPGAEPMRTTAS